MTDVAGKTVLVTGGASGIGLGMARAFARRAARIAVADIDRDRARAALVELSASTEAISIELDVTSRLLWEKAASQIRDSFGPLHILCNNAGVGGGPGLIDEYDFGTWLWTHDVNLHSMVHGLQVFLPEMKASDQRCHIVNTASMVALVPTPNSIAYLSSKAAVVALTEGLRHELRGHDIGVSLLCPGMSATRIVETSGKLRPGAQGIPNEKMAAMQTLLAGGMNPDAIGEKVVRSIEADDFYIFSHADWAPLFEAHAREIAEAFGESADPSHRDDLSSLLTTLQGPDSDTQKPSGKRPQ